MKQANSLMDKTNDLMDDVNGKMKTVEPVVKAAADLGESVSEINESSKKMVKRVSNAHFTRTGMLTSVITSAFARHFRRRGQD